MEHTVIGNVSMIEVAASRLVSLEEEEKTKEQQQRDEKNKQQKEQERKTVEVCSKRQSRSHVSVQLSCSQMERAQPSERLCQIV